jgi:PhzF family phenazine biosynthesis protein
MNAISIYQVDAFARRPFEGNPAAVCLLESAAPESWMQKVAQEMNLSETAFVVPRSTSGEFDLRWFTPKIEVDLCGHATLAAAHVLWAHRGVSRDQRLRFNSRSGWLEATADAEGVIELDFPLLITESTVAPSGLQQALGLATRPLEVRRGQERLLVVIDSERSVRTLKPDFGRIAEIDAWSVTITALAEPGTGFDFVSRLFAPRGGINEDPVTGSAHCRLAHYWSLRLGGKTEFMAYQASERGGELRVRIRGDRVFLGGHAVTVLEGKLATP